MYFIVHLRFCEVKKLFEEDPPQVEDLSGSEYHQQSEIDAGPSTEQMGDKTATGLVRTGPGAPILVTGVPVANAAVAQRAIRDLAAYHTHII